MLFVQPSLGFRGFAIKHSRSQGSLLFGKPGNAVWKVTVKHDGKDTVLNVKEDCSILTAAKDAGIDLPHDCEMGVCLTCPAKIMSGTVDSTGTTLDDSVIEEGYALTCATFPRSDMVIRSIEEDELINAQFQGNMGKTAKK